MTREEAIQELQNCKGLIQQDGQDYLDERDIPLLDMAIEALSERNIARDIATILENEQDMRAILQNDAVQADDRIEQNKIYCSPLVAENVEVVVRCKDCRWWNSETKGCKRNPSVEAWYETDFCKYGERLCNYFGERREP